MSYIVGSIEIVRKKTKDDISSDHTQTRLEYLQEKTEDEYSFLDCLVKNAPRILEQEKADTIQKPYRFYIESNNTIH